MTAYIAIPSTLSAPYGAAVACGLYEIASKGERASGSALRAPVEGARERRFIVEPPQNVNRDRHFRANMDAGGCRYGFLGLPGPDQTPLRSGFRE
jgi:hypothetical protein